MLRGFAIATLSGGLALLAGQQAALAYWRGLAPAMVPGMFASDPQLQVVASDSRIIENTGKLRQEAAHLRKIARAAIAVAPFNAIAMRQLGMLADLTHPNEAGRRHFETAEAITRRDLPNQVALINQTIGRGDLAAVLVHYDRALRVYTNAGDRLFPNLIRASSEQRVRDGLAHFATSPWFPAFFGQMIAVDQNPEGLTAFLIQVRPQLSAETADRLSMLLLGQLVAKGRYVEARNWIYRSQKSLAQGLDDLGFSPATTDRRVDSLAWSITSREGVELSLTKAGRLEILIGAGRHETIAERITILSPGQYDFTQVLSHEPYKPVARLSWELRCRPGASEAPIWQFEQASGVGQQRFMSHFRIPEGCQAQYWKLSAHSDSTQFESSVWIVDLAATRQ